MSVTAAPTGANPVDELPPAPLTAPQVAAYVSDQVFAKTGTVAGYDALNDRLAIGAETVAGYLETDDSRLHTVFVGVNGASAPDLQGLIDVTEDVALIAARLQEQAGPEPRRGDDRAPSGALTGPVAQPPTRTSSARSTSACVL
ncbi:hypothetical protein ACWGI0_35020 [Streptomyces sp. NPDC054802]